MDIFLEIIKAFGGAAVAIGAVGSILFFMFEERYKKFLNVELKQLDAKLESQRHYQDVISQHYQNSVIDYYRALGDIRLAISKADKEEIQRSLNEFNAAAVLTRFHAYGTGFEDMHERISKSLRAILGAINENRGDAEKMLTSVNEALEQHDVCVKEFIQFYHDTLKEMMAEPSS